MGYRNLICNFLVTRFGTHADLREGEEKRRKQRKAHRGRGGGWDKVVNLYRCQSPIYQVLVIGNADAKGRTVLGMLSFCSIIITQFLNIRCKKQHSNRKAKSSI